MSSLFFFVFSLPQLFLDSQMKCESETRVQRHSRQTSIPREARPHLPLWPQPWREGEQPMETWSLGGLWVSMVRNDQHHPELLLIKTPHNVAGASLQSMKWAQSLHNINAQNKHGEETCFHSIDVHHELCSQCLNQMVQQNPQGTILLKCQGERGWFKLSMTTMLAGKKAAQPPLNNNHTIWKKGHSEGRFFCQQQLINWLLIFGSATTMFPGTVNVRCWTKHCVIDRCCLCFL